MQGPGEALVDEVEVFKTAGSNLISNNGFESGAAGWSFFGNHSFVWHSSGYHSMDPNS